MAPVSERSGHSNGVHWRWRWSHFHSANLPRGGSFDTTAFVLGHRRLSAPEKRRGSPINLRCELLRSSGYISAPVPEDEDDLPRSDLLSRHERPRLAASSQTRRIALKWVDAPTQGVCVGRNAHSWLGAEMLADNILKESPTEFLDTP